MLRSIVGLLLVVLVASVLAVPFYGFGPLIVTVLAIVAAAVVCDVLKPAK
jgi:hypothetical protein